MRLIVTRPEPDASRTADALRRLGHEPIVSPMLDVHFDVRAVVPLRSYQAVLVTSSNAVRAAGAHPARARLAGLPLLAVGDQTALEAKRGGFRLAQSAGGAVNDLAALVARDLDSDDGPLLYVCGEAQAGDLSGQLERIGFQIETVVIYRSAARAELADAAVQAIRAGSVEGALLYSPRSAAAFAAAVRAGGLAPLSAGIACFCLSPAVAEPLQGVAAGPVLVADRPDQISLFAAVEEHARKLRSIAAG